MTSFDTLNDIAAHLRERLENKKYILLFAFNGTGKTRLSMAFKELGKHSDGEEETRDTLYFIKVSRGEENIFVWCFFLAVAQLAVDQEEGSPYAWVKYLYIEDPISSLDDNNAIAVASHLAQLLKNANGQIKTVISTHHHLFFNVMCNELRKPDRYFLSCVAQQYLLKDTGNTPRFHHIAVLKQLHEVAESGEICTYHFNILRGVLEKTATFHGFQHFSSIIRQLSDDQDGILFKRLVDLFSHGNYSLYEPQEMMPENKEYFRKILSDFMDAYHFNPELFPAVGEGQV